jgi:hypothetical protein
MPAETVSATRQLTVVLARYSFTTVQLVPSAPTGITQLTCLFSICASASDTHEMAFKVRCATGWANPHDHPIATSRCPFAVSKQCKRLCVKHAGNAGDSHLLLHFGPLLLLLFLLQTTFLAVAILACLAFAQADGQCNFCVSLAEFVGKHPACTNGAHRLHASQPKIAAAAVDS